MAQRAINALIRPPRTNYNIKELSLCLTVEGGANFLRHPVSFTNNRGINLVGSVYHAAQFSPLNGGPCVVYLHGNASSQLEGQFLVPNFCPYGVFVFCFDFAGCGCSEGDYVSLGYFEQQDTNYLLNVLHQTFNLGPFVLWGRSMGASTALLVQNPLVVGKISDSSFTSVDDMCTAIASSMKFPAVFVSMAIWYLRKKVISVANFNFDEVSPLVAVSHGPQAPVVFGHAEKDQFIPYEQCKLLYESYNSKNKYIMQLPGGHNSRRKIDWITLGVIFAFDQLGLPSDNLKISDCRKLQQTTFHFSSFNAMVQHSPDVGDNKIIEQYESEVHSSQSDSKTNTTATPTLGAAPAPNMSRQHSHVRRRSHARSMKYNTSSGGEQSLDESKRKKRRHHSKVSLIDLHPPNIQEINGEKKENNEKEEEEKKQLESLTPLSPLSENSPKVELSEMPHNEELTPQQQLELQQMKENEAILQSMNDQQNKETQQTVENDKEQLQQTKPNEEALGDNQQAVHNEEETKQNSNGDEQIKSNEETKQIPNDEDNNANHQIEPNEEPKQVQNDNEQSKPDEDNANHQIKSNEETKQVQNDNEQNKSDEESNTSHQSVPTEEPKQLPNDNEQSKPDEDNANLQSVTTETNQLPNDNEQDAPNEDNASHQIELKEEPKQLPNDNEQDAPIEDVANLQSVTTETKQLPNDNEHDATDEAPPCHHPLPPLPKKPTISSVGNHVPVPPMPSYSSASQSLHRSRSHPRQTLPPMPPAAIRSPASEDPFLGCKEVPKLMPVQIPLNRIYMSSDDK
ncbi:Clan SC, family S9, unassigned serine peptidase [Histomonas meleagridis]|uniref:Clan SC, family S9, unassigned serine peptidase n=1 Tax=Histomonas meleagridis TaxID=135588 RepID=UPI003559D7F9|nr:Clan SC, family S9, unassigned serine peptidase [Histomonas meleagridis]KAH0805819.1 Clan SC, family S9, unassigned serine peptidase [Histomonas meleagridis]